jgi:hypothetical protein
MTNHTPNDSQFEPEIWLISQEDDHQTLDLTTAVCSLFANSAAVDGLKLWQLIRTEDDESISSDSDNERQYELTIRNMCLLARSFSEAGFVPVLRIKVRSEYYLDAFRNYLRGGVLRLITVSEDDTEPFADTGLHVNSKKLDIKDFMKLIEDNIAGTRIM